MDFGSGRDNCNILKDYVLIQQFDFGTAYEIEIETDKPEQAKLEM